MTSARREAENMTIFELSDSDCRLIADGLAAGAALHGHELSKARWKQLNQLGVLFENYATPPKKEKK